MPFFMFRFFIQSPEIDCQHEDTNSKADITDVESRPERHIKIINHVSKIDPVKQITKSTAEDKGARYDQVIALHNL